MNTLNILQAMSGFSSLLEAIEHGEEREVIITRDGQPIARLVPMEGAVPRQRIGAVRGAFDLPEESHTSCEVVASLFLGEAQRDIQQPYRH